MRKRMLVVAGLVLCPVVFVAEPATAGGCAEVSSGRSAAVDLKGLCIWPTLVHVAPGAAVTFVNRDEVDHVIVGAGFAWGSGDVMHQGDAFTATFSRDGVYPFQCYLHPGMSGAVIVGDANGRGAATSGGVTVPLASETRPTMTPPPAPTPAADRSAFPWPAVALSALILASALGTALVRSRTRSSREAGNRPAGAGAGGRSG